MGKPSKTIQSQTFIELLVVVISMVTVLSGLVQLFTPEFILGIVGKGEVSPAMAHFFAIIGMFMALFGGMVLHTLYSSRTSKVILLWAALQKFGAFLAVTLGVFNGLFSILALGVALFDFFSGFVMLYYMQKLKQWE
ncbi:patatin [Negadavirga shengliensis]|uniref:Patatin n=1 Tax=Negadavirga shengliensis TaxID=1389218 RepID=A0ABV9T6A6_9BACT